MIRDKCNLFCRYECIIDFFKNFFCICRKTPLTTFTQFTAWVLTQNSITIWCYRQRMFDCKKNWADLELWAIHKVSTTMILKSVKVKTSSIQAIEDDCEVEGVKHQHFATFFNWKSVWPKTHLALDLISMHFYCIFVRLLTRGFYIFFLSVVNSVNIKALNGGNFSAPTPTESEHRTCRGGSEFRWAQMGWMDELNKGRIHMPVIFWQ